LGLLLFFALKLAVSSAEGALLLAGLFSMLFGSSLLTDKVAYREWIAQASGKHLYCPGRSGQTGGKYIMKRLEN